MSFAAIRITIELKSLASADGFFRVVGRTPDSYKLERIAAFAVLKFKESHIDFPKDFVMQPDTIVGIPMKYVGVIGNSADDFLLDVAGYVHESDTFVEHSSGQRKLKDGVEDTLVWE